MYIVVYVTVGTKEEGEKLARGLIKEKLAACVNIIPSVQSVYWWKGEIEEAEEVLLIIKTIDSLFELLTAWVKDNHTYSVPEIISLPVLKGNTDYLNWIEDTVKRN